MSQAAGSQGRMATAEEAKALGHPIRVRILQLVRQEALTNKQISERLGKTPGATLHHVKVLANQGFVQKEVCRLGKRGAKEVPYSATEKSWGLSFREGDKNTETVGDAILNAALSSHLSVPPSNRFGETSAILNLDEVALDELRTKLRVLLSEFRDRPALPGAQRYGVFWALHRFR